MLGSISWSQLREWMAFADLEPFDEERSDWRTAHLAHIIANANRNPKKRKKPYTVADLLMRFGDIEKPKQSWKEQAAAAKMFVMMAKAEETARAKQAERRAQRNERAAGARIVRRVPTRRRDG